MLSFDRACRAAWLLLGMACLPFLVRASVVTSTPRNAPIEEGDSCSFLCNYNFEDTVFIKPGQFTFVNQKVFPCWKTTASDGLIEIWGDGYGGVPAYSGKYFVELNANMVSTLYQDFQAVPGSTAWVSFAHRGRAGTDVMSVELGPVGGPYTPIGTFSAGNNAWEYHTLSFTFPINKGTDYSLRFKSVSAAGGATVGNFLDAISIKLPRPWITLDAVQPKCTLTDDGALSVEVLEGSAPFSYVWSIPGVGDTTAAAGLGPGTYAVTVTDFYGCRSVGEIDLVPSGAPVFTTISLTACEGDSVPFGNGYLKTSGSYTDTLSTTLGCDSILQLTLDIVPPLVSLEQATACGPYTWNGTTFDSSGTYSFLTTAASGCDSTAWLELTIRQPSASADTVRTCTAFTWPVNGETYTQGGVYQEVLVNSVGCDSLVTLLLELLPAQRDTVAAYACSSYVWSANGQTYTEDGDYVLKLQNAQGCDSVVVLRLDILEPTEALVTMGSCGDFLWELNGSLYTQSGTYQHVLTNTAGCDSTVTLELTIHPGTRITDTIVAVDAYQWPISGETYTESGTYQLILTDQRGCDSVLILLLEILPRPMVYIPNAFSPDADGINDRFTVFSDPHVRRIHHLTIFDRWGNCVFRIEEMEPNDPAQGWDGTCRERLMDPAVFVYFLEAELFDGSRWPFKGEIHLVR